MLSAIQRLNFDPTDWLMRDNQKAFCKTNTPFMSPCSEHVLLNFFLSDLYGPWLSRTFPAVMREA